MISRRRIVGRRTFAGRGGAVRRSGVTMVGGQGWDNANTLATAAGNGLRGTAADGVWIAVLLRVDAVPTANENPASCLDGSGKGWDLNNAAANGVYGFRVGNGAGNAFVTSPTYTFTAADVGKIHLMYGANDVANSLARLYVARAQVGAGSAVVGYTPAQATIRTALGSRANFALNSAGSFTLFGLVGGAVQPTQAEIEGLYDAVKLAGDVVAIAGKTTTLYSVKQDAAGSFPATLADKAGTSGSMTFTVGAASGVDLVTVSNPTFAW